MFISYSVPNCCGIFFVESYSKLSIDSSIIGRGSKSKTTHVTEDFEKISTKIVSWEVMVNKETPTTYTRQLSDKMCSWLGKSRLTVRISPERSVYGRSADSFSKNQNQHPTQTMDNYYRNKPKFCGIFACQDKKDTFLRIISIVIFAVTSQKRRAFEIRMLHAECVTGMNNR